LKVSLEGPSYVERIRKARARYRKRLGSKPRTVKLKVKEDTKLMLDDIRQALGVTYDAAIWRLYVEAAQAQECQKGAIDRIIDAIINLLEERGLDDLVPSILGIASSLGGKEEEVNEGEEGQEVELDW
jgi:hypothetical protein